MVAHVDSHYMMEGTKLFMFLHQTQAESWSKIFITWRHVKRQVWEDEHNYIRGIPLRPTGGHIQPLENNTTGCHALSRHRQLQIHLTCNVDIGAKVPQQEVATNALLHHGG
jgi:hypothetical protein